MKLTAVEPCSDHIGALAPGVTVRSGTITADSSCTSTRRLTSIGSNTYYARRHTFRLAQETWVTVELADDPANATPLDTYLIILDGHSPTGSSTSLHADDNSGTGTDSEVSSVKLPAGSYTIEATTSLASTTAAPRIGSYQLTVSAAVINGLGDQMHLNHNTATRFVFDYAPRRRPHRDRTARRHHRRGLQPQRRIRHPHPQGHPARHLQRPNRHHNPHHNSRT